MKVATIVGARTQFIKAAVVTHELRNKHHEVLIHTGQHFDPNMSDTFFEELQIPKPDYNLGISGGTHAQMTGQMMIAIEEVLVKEQPDWVLLYGDTNSTLAAALAAAKLCIPIAHVEAGTRTHFLSNPEEINRICTDHVSTLLMASTEEALDNLKNEGLGEKSVFVGNTMYDAFLEYSKSLPLSDITLTLLNGKEASVPNQYFYMTCHRAENTNTDENLKEIFDAMEALEYPTIYPVHPRNKERAVRLQEKEKYEKLILCEPVGYLESMALLCNCEKVVTDSGGLQTEAFFAQKKCVTILDFVCWPETMVSNRNELAKPKASEILEKLHHVQILDATYRPFGDGHAARKIVAAMEKHIL